MTKLEMAQIGQGNTPPANRKAAKTEQKEDFLQMLLEKRQAADDKESKEPPSRKGLKNQENLHTPAVLAAVESQTAIAGQLQAKAAEPAVGKPHIALAQAVESRSRAPTEAALHGIIQRAGGESQQRLPEHIEILRRSVHNQGDHAGAADKQEGLETVKGTGAFAKAEAQEPAAQEQLPRNREPQPQGRARAVGEGIEEFGDEIRQLRDKPQDFGSRPQALRNGMQKLQEPMKGLPDRLKELPDQTKESRNQIQGLRNEMRERQNEMKDPLERIQNLQSPKQALRGGVQEPGQLKTEAEVLKKSQIKAVVRGGKSPEAADMTAKMIPDRLPAAYDSSGAQKTTGAQERVRTTPAQLPTDIGKAIAARLPLESKNLTIELEPASLGKVTIQVVCESGRTSVSLISANPDTLKILSQNAGEIAGILEDKTGRETIIYTCVPQKEFADSRDSGGEGHRDSQERKEDKRKSRPDSFIQQLRLGLV